MTKPDTSGKSRNSRKEALIVPQVRTTALSGTQSFFERLNLPIVRLLEKSGIDPTTLGDPHQTVNLHAFCQFWEEAVRDTNVDNIGLRYGASFKLLDLGMIGYVVANCANLREALAQLSRLLPIHQEATILNIDDAGPEVSVDYLVIDDQVELQRQDAELSVAILLNACRHYCGSDWAPAEVHFKHAKPVNWRDHEDTFAAATYFGQPTNGLIMTRQDLATPNPMQDHNLLRILQPIADEQLKAFTNPTTLIDLVKQRIDANIAASNNSIEKVGKELGIGYRTLQRRLKDADLTFSDMVDDVRRTNARRYLRDPSVSLTELSLMLGYSDSSAFNCVFKRWFGQPPRDYRRDLLNGVID